MADENADLRKRAVKIALEEVKKNVKESDGPNRGPEVDKYMRRAHAPLGKAYNWCGMFVNYVYTEAAAQLGKNFPIPSGMMWSGPKLKRWALNNMDKVVWELPLRPGDIYVLYRGHIGMVGETYTMEDIFDGSIVSTIDGNQVVGSEHHPDKVSLKQRRRDFADMEYVIRV